MHLADQLLFSGGSAKKDARVSAPQFHKVDKNLSFFLPKVKTQRVVSWGQAAADLRRHHQGFLCFPQVWFLPPDNATGLLVMLLLPSPAQTLRSLVRGRCSLSSNVNAPILHRRGSAWRADEALPWVQTEATPQTDEITAGFTDWRRHGRTGWAGRKLNEVTGIRRLGHLTLLRHHKVSSSSLLQFNSSLSLF